MLRKQRSQGCVPAWPHAGLPLEIFHFPWLGCAKSCAAGSWSTALVLPVLVDGQGEGKDVLSLTLRTLANVMLGPAPQPVRTTTVSPWWS